MDESGDSETSFVRLRLLLYIQGLDKKNVYRLFCRIKCQQHNKDVSSTERESRQ